MSGRFNPFEEDNFFTDGFHTDGRRSSRHHEQVERRRSSHQPARSSFISDDRRRSSSGRHVHFSEPERRTFGTTHHRIDSREAQRLSSQRELDRLERTTRPRGTGTVDSSWARSSDPAERQIWRDQQYDRRARNERAWEQSGWGDMHIRREGSSHHRGFNPELDRSLARGDPAARLVQDSHERRFNSGRSSFGGFGQPFARRTSRSQSRRTDDDADSD